MSQHLFGKPLFFFVLGALLETNVYQTYICPWIGTI